MQGTDSDVPSMSNLPEQAGMRGHGQERAPECPGAAIEMDAEPPGEQGPQRRRAQELVTEAERDQTTQSLQDEQHDRRASTSRLFLEGQVPLDETQVVVGQVP
jgi:hypothetical protein